MTSTNASRSLRWRLLGAIACGYCALQLAVPVAAFEIHRGFGGVPDTISPTIVANPIQVVLWVWPTVSPADEAWITPQIQAGLQLWEQVPTSRIRFTTTTIHSATAPMVPGALLVHVKTLSDPGGGGADLPEAGNPGVWQGAVADFRGPDCPDPCDRYRFIAAHEIGHAIGFMHSTISHELFGYDATPVMYFTGGQEIGLTADDRAVVSVAYPEPGTPLAGVTGELRGRCLNPLTNRVVTGVNVIAVDTATGVPAIARLTGAGGEAGIFDLVGIPPGTYELRFLDGDSTRGGDLGLGSNQVQADNFTTFTQGPYVVSSGSFQDVGTASVAIGPAALAPGGLLPPATGGAPYTPSPSCPSSAAYDRFTSIEQAGFPAGIGVAIEDLTTFTYEHSGHSALRFFGTPQQAGRFRCQVTLRDAHEVESEVAVDLAVADSLANPVCTGGAGIVRSSITLKRLGPPAGDEAIDFRGTAEFPSGTLATLDPGPRARNS